MKNKKQSLKLIFASFAAAATVAVVPLSQTAVFANENAAQKTTIETIDCSNLPAPDLSDYKTLTDAERTKLIEADKKAQDITAQMDKLLGEDGKVTDQAKLDQLQTQLDDLYKSVESIPAKVDAGNASKAKEELKDYLNQSGLTDKEKADYLSKSETIRNLEGQLEALFDKNGHVTDQAKADALEKELNGLYDVIDALDAKVEAEQIKANKNLTDKEKDTLITTYAQINKLNTAYEALFDKDGNITDQAKADELDKKLEELEASVESAEAKLCDTADTEK